MANFTLKNASEAVKAGTVLGLELKARGISQRKFAEQIAIQPSHLSEIITGKRNLTEALAKKIEEGLDIPASHWLQLQAKYDIAKKEAELESNAETDALLLIEAYDKIYDLRLIFKRHGYSKAKPSEQLAFCYDKLHFRSPEEQRMLVQGRFHRSEKTGLDTRMIATWAELAKYQASTFPKPAAAFDSAKLDEMARKLRVVFHENVNTTNRVQCILGDYGIKFCVVQKVPRASIDGYSFVDEDGVPSIVVTLRYNRIDNFAFAVMHEVGHLKLHLDSKGKWDVNLPIAGNEDLNTKEEKEANNYAANALIPSDLWQDTPEAPMNPYAIQGRYKKWAKAKGLNMWIVLGRLSHETGIYMFKSDNSREIN